MTLFLVSIGLLLISAMAAILASRSPRTATLLGAGGAVAACGLGLVAAVPGVHGPEITLRWCWLVPGGAFNIAIDPLSAVFLIPIFGLSLVAAIYGGKYMLSHAGRRPVGWSWGFFNLLIGGMAMVVVARNAVLFLMSWEMMAVASFFLVTFEDDKPSVRSAGWTYLVASHLGTSFLFVMFLLMGSESLDFDRLTAAAGPGVLFLLAIVGFGTKAGFMPFHVWLPEAHPAAPSHVSAVMSGVMIKTGIYGLLRILLLLGPPPPWWGWVLVAVGMTSGVLGMMFALARHDLKRLLAYSSVENIGIITLGLGTGLLGISYHSPLLAFLGFAGGLFHMLNHAIFKGLLFLGAGAVAHGADTLKIDRLGGLARRMPWTAGAFAVGAVSIVGLPPFNGFASEFLIYMAALEGIRAGSGPAVLGAIIISGLALIGGLAAACFAKAFGVIFLGEPRSQTARRAHEVSGWMRFPMVALAALVVMIGFAGAAVAGFLEPAVTQLTGFPVSLIEAPMTEAASLLWRVAVVTGCLVLLLIGLGWYRRVLLSGRTVSEAGTWDCGYIQPAERMQYTSSSFAQPLLRVFAAVAPVRTKHSAPAGIVPSKASLKTQAFDPAREWLFAPLFRFIERAASCLYVIQDGRVNVYLLYVALTLVVLLFWSFLWLP